jgi:integrase
MNEKILEKYKIYLRQEYRIEKTKKKIKKNTFNGHYGLVKKFLQKVNKPHNNISRKDLDKWRNDIEEEYETNGNIRRIQSVNLFFKWLKKPHMKLPTPRQEETKKTVLNKEELERYLETSKRDPLDYLIALLQIDGKLRPSEFGNIKISNIDQSNQILYLEDTKTGNNSIPISPRLSQAIERYRPYRKPLPGYEDYLIIIPKGRYQGMAPNERGELVRNHTKQIAIKANIDKPVLPYTIKRLSITADFNEGVNPKIIQRTARHKRIETTLLYNQVTDEMVRQYFNDRDKNLISPSPEKRQDLLYERYKHGEIDRITLNKGLETLEAETHRKDFEHDPAIG